METWRHTRAEEQVEGPGGAIDPAPLLGTWLNTDHDSRGVVRIVLSPREGGGIAVRATGAGSPSPIDWGEVPGGVYAENAGAGRAAAFGALYDFGFLRVHLQGKTNRGVLVLAMFNEFRDGSGRSSYFNREFFYLDEEPARSSASA